MALAEEAIAKNNGWVMSGKTCRLQGSAFRTHGGVNPKTGQAGGLPESFCCNAPDLRIGKRVMSDSSEAC